MPNDLTVVVKHVLFVGNLKGAVVVNQERFTFPGAVVGDEADMIWKDNNVAALPFGDLTSVGSKTLDVA